MVKKKTLVIKQLKSAIRKPKYQEQNLIGLGLNKINKVRELEDTPAVRGMIKKVSHLVEIISK